MSTDPKLPWFKFEPQVWLSDKEVRKLTHSQRGIYMDLLSIDWISRGIPENPSEACNLITGGAKVKDVEPVLALFKSKLSGGIVTHKRNERQRMEFAEKSEASRASAKSRWKGRGRDANASESHADRGCETDADALRTHSERTADAVPTDMRNACEIDAEGHAKGMPRALARDERLKKEDKIKNKTLPEASSPISAREAACSREGASASPVPPAAHGRPATQAEAVALCRAQMVDAPEEFVAAKFDALEAVDWRDTTGRNEVSHFGAYVRAAWRNHKQREHDVAGCAPVAIDEALCEEVRTLWNEVAASRRLIRSRVSPGIAAKRAICGAFAGFKGGDGPPGDSEAAKRFRLGTFRILFVALAEDPASNGARGKPVDFEFAVSPRGINYAAERAGL